MRYTVFLLAFMLLFITSYATAVKGEGDCMEQEIHSDAAGPCSMMENREPCEYPCMAECNDPCMAGEEGRFMGRGRGMWFDRPWNIWRHLDEDSLDYDAMHFMSDVRTVAILPFSDMTVPTYQGDSVLAQAGGARRMVDNLAAALMRRGYLVIPATDVNAVMQAYFRSAGTMNYLTDETANNLFWFEKLPERALNFYMNEVSGLEAQSQRIYATSGYSVAPNDVIALADALGADCVIRGFVHEFAVDEDIDADLRTLFPPFLGLISPDRRMTMEVAYYIYEGATGEMVWNGTFQMTRDSEWPIFNSERELVANAEMDAVGWFMDKTVPNWMDLVMAHPEWIPFDMWYDCEGGRMFEEHPDWLNPHRRGWHDFYGRSDWRFDMREPVDNEHRRLRFDGLTHYYRGINDWRQRANND